MKRKQVSHESVQDDHEKEVLRLRVEIAALREENLLLRKVNTMNGEALRETSKIFQSLKPKRPFLSSEKKLYIAGEQLFKCAAPHGVTTPHGVTAPHGELPWGASLSMDLSPD